MLISFELDGTIDIVELDAIESNKLILKFQAIVWNKVKSENPRIVNEDLGPGDIDVLGIEIE